MVIKAEKRKTRSDKFPLTLHPTGQYCKKIKGKLHYFGVDKTKALQRYMEQATRLHTGRSSPSESTSEEISIKTLCNLYLEFQESKMLQGELSSRHFSDQINSLRKLTKFLGPHSLTSEIITLELQNYKRKLVQHFGSKHRINLHLAIMKAMFHWAKKNEILREIPNIDAVSKMKLVKEERPTFSVKQINQLIEKASPQLQAMIWLGLNCGFGGTDCSDLLWKNIDMGNRRIQLSRRKTGVNRNLPLWEETIDILKRLPRGRDRVFNTPTGKAWVRTKHTVDVKGNMKFTRIDSVSKEFSKLMKSTKMRKDPGMGFYTLRRTAATLAAKSGDPFAVKELLGHADLTMATTYVQDVSEQTDRVIHNSRNLIVQGDS